MQDPVHPAVRPAHPVHERHDVLLGADVRLPVDHVGAQQPQLLQERVLGLVPRGTPGQHDPGPVHLRGDVPREQRAQPTGTTGDQVDAAVLPRQRERGCALELAPPQHLAHTGPVPDRRVRRHGPIGVRTGRGTLRPVLRVDQDQLPRNTGVLQLSRLEDACQARPQPRVRVGRDDQLDADGVVRPFAEQLLDGREDLPGVVGVTPVDARRTGVQEHDPSGSA
ncbi:hypothetical protein GCM10010219_25810 [Streptomyces netropsis]|nr:hypothetical protein GCM10010219_25810 [Streptomyces netropsis]